VKLLVEISVLAEGYVISLEGGKLRASPTAVLIEDAGTRVLVDPGADKRGLLRGLSGKGLVPGDVDLVFVTHTHLDHILNLRLFPEADVCDSSYIYRGDEEIPYGNFVPGTKIEVLSTPGHSPDHASLLVHSGDEIWLVAGDLFWWRDGAVQRTDPASLLALEDESASDPAALRTSRMMALARADVVIPGHGKIFRPDRRADLGLR
jgi:glyoxylase-like metal-dependent hydrolase (beta-lactamase superfamily II)